MSDYISSIELLPQLMKVHELLLLMKESNAENHCQHKYYCSVHYGNNDMSSL